MKKGLHPGQYRLVVFKDMSNGHTFLSRSTAGSKETIKWDDGNEYFFHNSACNETRFDDLREGQAVTFDRGQGPKGPRAENVTVR